MSQNPIKNEDTTRYNAVLQAITQLTLQFSEFKKKFDADNNGTLSLQELKNALKNPIGKRYFLVFVVIALNITVAIVQYYLNGNPINVNTLITLLFSASTVIFAGYIENVNQSLLKEKEREIDQLKLQLLESHKNSIKKDSEIEILKEKLARYEKK